MPCVQFLSICNYRKHSAYGFSMACVHDSLKKAVASGKACLLIEHWGVSAATATKQYSNKSSDSLELSSLTHTSE